MDSDVVLVRLGTPSLDRDILTSVNSGQSFLVSFVHKGFGEKREVNKFKALKADTFGDTIIAFG